MFHDENYERTVTTDRTEIASVLDEMADGIRGGVIQVGDDTDEVTISIPDELTLEFELEREDGEMSLELELEWPLPSDVNPESSNEGPAGDEVEDVKISGMADASVSQPLAQFEVYQDRNEEYRWRLRHRNGNIIATGGEGYTRKHNALKGLRSVIKNASGAAVNGAFTN